MLNTNYGIYHFIYIYSHCFSIAPFHPNIVEEYRAKGELHKLTEQYNELKKEIYSRMGDETKKSIRSIGNNKVIVIIMNYSNLSVIVFLHRHFIKSF
jgi:hypothetical protein